MTDQLDGLKLALGDRYTIQRELGRGGMAVVYLAHDQKHDRPVAVKVLRPELGASLGGERFLREIQIAAKLTHPNILMLIDSGEGDGLLYYVMPLVEGESLRDRLTREKQLPIEDALQITKEVADALGYAHSLGIVHRDVKRQPPEFNNLGYLNESLRLEAPLLAQLGDTAQARKVYDHYLKLRPERPDYEPWAATWDSVRAEYAAVGGR